MRQARPVAASPLRRRRGAERRSRDAEQSLVQLAQERGPVAVLQGLDERAPDRIRRGRLHSHRRRARSAPRAAPIARSGSVSSRTAARSGHVSPSSATKAARSCSERNGSCWKSDSSQRSSASASALSASARREPDEQLAGERRHGTSRGASHRRAAASPRSAGRAGCRTGARRASRRAPARRRAAPRSQAGSR